MADACVALPDWARAHGEPVLTAELRQAPEDFQVTEVLGFEPSGDGEHDFLWIEKTGANTAWVARQLAVHAGVPARDVGFAGLKDRHALTRQWFSVRRPNRDGSDWRGLDVPGVRILDKSRNVRKLRRGAHRANRFRIALRARGIDACRAALGQRLGSIEAAGVPNYFGEQRFGRDGANLAQARALFAGARLARNARGFAISAARSYLFNAILDRRVRAGLWDRLMAGDVANLDATQSVFDVEVLTPELAARCADFDIHPAATLWGRGAPRSRRDALDFENAAVRDDADLADGLVAARVDAASRALRMRVGNLRIEYGSDVAWLEFRLPRGSFATALLREIVRTPGEIRADANPAGGIEASGR